MNEHVWVKPKSGQFSVPIGARIISTAQGHELKIIDDNNEEYTVTTDDILRPMHITSVSGVDDMIMLGELQEHSILRNLLIRYYNDLIYTYIGSMLVAVNPYKQLNIYNKTKMIEYRKKKLGEAPPHIFAIADYSFESMRKTSEKCCIVISGESGSGKTETMKLLLQYFAWISPKISEKENQILDSNLILEAFGNAKTNCNNNSSRFGKYVTIRFKVDGSIESAQIQHYLLEKSRIVTQSTGEHNYHIFYTILNGMSSIEKQNLGLKEAYSYEYLNLVNEETSEGDDIMKLFQFNRVEQAMRGMGFSEEELHEIYKIIAAILNLGNIQFKEKTICHVESVELVLEEEIEKICQLLGIDKFHFTCTLQKKTILTHGEEVTAYFSKQQAIVSRDAFSKKTYENLFNYVVRKINEILYPGKKTLYGYIGLLDIFGFEALDRNGFEQLCINYANEMLQQFLVKNTLKTEQELYKNEGVNWKFIEYPNNQEILDLIDEGPTSILSILNDESIFPKASDQTLLEKLIEFHSENINFLRPKFKTISVFGIKHFAGVVLYDINNFLEKNRDVFNREITEVIRKSKNRFLKTIFHKDLVFDHTTNHKKKTETLVSKFKLSLESLITELNQCQTFFVRCIKPNESKHAHKFDRLLCWKQLRYSGTMEVTKLREAGYPIRYDYINFVQRYRILCPEIPLAHKTNCQEATKKICSLVFKNWDRPKYQFGNTMIFLKRLEENFLEDKRNESLYSYVLSIQKVARGWIQRRRYKKLRKSASSLQNLWRKKKCKRNETRRKSLITSKLTENNQKQDIIVRLQSYCRGFLVRNLMKLQFEEHSKTKIIENENEIDNESLDQLKQIKSDLQMSIFIYVGALPEQNKPEGPVQGILRKILCRNDEDKNIFQPNEMYKKWWEIKANDYQKLQFIVGHGIIFPDLRAHIYTALYKIIESNMPRKAIKRAWELLCACIVSFLPPTNLDLENLKKLIQKEDANKSNYLLKNLERTRRNGARTEPPCCTELLALQELKPIETKIHFMNGGTTVTKIDSATTAKEILDLVSKNIDLRDTFGFAIVVEQDNKYTSIGDSCNFVLDAIAHCEQYAMDVGEQLEGIQWKLYLKLEMFAPWNDYIESNSVSSELICSQIGRGLKSREYKCNVEDLYHLIAHVCYSEQGRVKPAYLRAIIDNYIPNYIQESFDDQELSFFKEMVKTFYVQLYKKTKDSIREHVIHFAQRCWLIEFSKFFYCSGTLKSRQGSLHYLLRPIILAVNSFGVIVMEESDEREILVEFDFIEIQQLSKTMIDQDYTIEIATYNDVQISIKMQTKNESTLYELLSKIMEKLKQYSKYALATTDYKSADTSFLDLKKGDLIYLKEKYNGNDLLQNSWAYGQNARTEETGKFLYECVEIIPSIWLPSQSFIETIRKAEKTSEPTQLLNKLKPLKALGQHTLEAYAVEFFIEEKKQNETIKQWRHSNEKIKKPLHAKLTHNEVLTKESKQIFQCILEYMGDGNGNKKMTDEETVHRILGPGLEHEDLRDEIYCQILKQLTFNEKQESEARGWELMWMVTGLFSCSPQLAKEVKKFLESRKVIKAAEECLFRFNEISVKKPRKCETHTIEIESTRHFPCIILHKIFFPDNTHKFFKINSLTTGSDLKEAVLKRLSIEQSEGFSLFAQILGRVFEVPDDFYIFDCFQQYKRWALKNKKSLHDTQYQLFLMKNHWRSSIPGKNNKIDHKFLFPQEYNKYIAGYYSIPDNDAVYLAALLYKICQNFATSEDDHSKFENILPKILPKNMIKNKKTEEWKGEIESFVATNKIFNDASLEIQFLEYISKMPLYGSKYFPAELIQSNSTNYVFYPVKQNTQEFNFSI